MHRVKPVNVVAFTQPESFWHPVYEDISPIQYQRVFGLWQRDPGGMGRYVGNKNTTNHTEHELELSETLAGRLMNSFSRIHSGESVNCHRFARDMAGMNSSTEEPLLDFEKLPKVNDLVVGAIGVIGVKGHGVTHSMGYGMGDKSLQVMSISGELGIASNTDVLSFYEELFKKYEVGLYQAAL